jgi:hypothetical protein
MLFHIIALFQQKEERDLEVEDIVPENIKEVTNQELEEDIILKL